MIVAYFGTHVEGVESGILDAPGQDSQLSLIDLYEADITVRTFETREEADRWLDERHQEVDDE